jgi:hypothetical protein
MMSKFKIRKGDPIKSSNLDLISTTKLIFMNNNLACRVCGMIQDEPPWGDDGQSPNYIICECCGTEFGYGDCTIKAIYASRSRWLANGAGLKTNHLIGLPKNR